MFTDKTTIHECHKQTEPLAAVLQQSNIYTQKKVVTRCEFSTRILGQKQFLAKGHLKVRSTIDVIPYIGE